MEPIDSVEVRWFFSGDDPRVEAFTARFKALRATRDDPREDRYRRTGRDDLGVKVRDASGKQAKLETKTRTAALGTVTLVDGVVGVMERWRKAGERVDVTEATREGEWVATRKRRSRLVLPFEDDDLVCAVEWTRVDVERERWWTFGVEATDVEGAPSEVLRRACAAVIEDALAVSLGAESSMGYPAWIEALAARRGWR